MTTDGNWVEDDAVDEDDCIDEDDGIDEDDDIDEDGDVDEGDDDKVVVDDDKGGRTYEKLKSFFKIWVYFRILKRGFELAI